VVKVRYVKPAEDFESSITRCFDCPYSKASGKELFCSKLEKPRDPYSGMVPWWTVPNYCPFKEV